MFNESSLKMYWGWGVAGGIVASTVSTNYILDQMWFFKRI